MPTTGISSSIQSRRRPLHRILNLFGDVKAEEALTVFLMMCNIFLILAGYYVSKTVREPLILASWGAKEKSYLSGVMAIVLVGFIPLYGWFSSKVERKKLLFGFNLFFLLTLEFFWMAAMMGVSDKILGIMFFVWVGIFNNSIIAQFWSFGNDLYRTEAGQRLFPVIGIGMTLGAILGPKLAGVFSQAEVWIYHLLQFTAISLVLSMALYWWIERREREMVRQQTPPLQLKSGSGGFRLLLKNPYLLLICLLIILLNLVNTTGGFIMDETLVAEAKRLAPLDLAAQKKFLLDFSAGFLFWVNTAAALIQMFLVSRIVKYLGMAGALLTLPLVALGAYGMVFSGVTLLFLRVAKIAENSCDYSIMNTARAMLWLPTSREEKYKAKQAADTFIVRAGDVLSAVVVLVGTTFLGLGLQWMTGFNLLICSAWLVVAFLLLRRYQRLAAAKQNESISV